MLIFSKNRNELKEITVLKLEKTSMVTLPIKRCKKNGEIFLNG